MTLTMTRQRGSDFAKLSQQVRAAGLLDRRYGYYAATITATVGLYAIGWVSFALLGDSWFQLLVAALLAVAFTQLAFLGHDAGHRQIFRSRWASELTGLLAGNLGVGLSYGWWIDKHSRHHANPNHSEHDPDVGAGALVWTPEQAAERRGLGRWMARRQAYLFFPLLLLEGVNLHVASARAIAGRSTPMRRRAVEAVLLTAHLAGYLAAVFMVLSPLKAVLFIAIHQGLFGLYMGCSFAPNHKGMPVLTPEDELDFLRKQVLTSRNVRGGRFTDVLFGGLNYQIEHHLFPNMPRANLPKAQAIVRRYCAELDVDYTETGIVDSYRQGLTHLHEVGAGLRSTVD